MSSRKRKRDKRPQEAGEVAPADDQAVDSESAEDESEDTGEAESSDNADAQPDAPAVSEISELKPRSKRKRVAVEQADVAEEVVESDAPEPDEDDEDESVGSDTAKEAPKTRAQLKRVIESLIFVSDQVITAQQLGRIAKTKIADVREMLAEIAIDFEGRGVELVEVNGGYQFRSAAASAAYVRVLVAQKPVRLTRAQLETLALIAYRQPITRPEVDDVRGVDSGSAIKVLLDRDLIKILGRKEDAGRPLLYGTTPFFLEFFGMNTMQELPTLREFTELSDEHRELFQRKTNEIGDLSAEAERPIPVARERESDERGGADEDADATERWDAEPATGAEQDEEPSAQADAEPIDEAVSAPAHTDDSDQQDADASAEVDDDPDTRGQEESNNSAAWDEPDDGTNA